MNIYPTHKEKSFLEYNLIENPSPETNFKGWAAGTGSGSAPTAQVVAGASDLVISRNQSSPLFGSADFHIAKPASNCQGQFYFTEFVIPKGLEFQPLDIEFLTRNVGLLEGDVKLFVIEKATDSVIQIPFGDVFGEGLLRFQFQALASGVYQFVFWVSSTNAVAWDLYFDQLKVYPAKGQFIPFMSDWQSYTPVVSGLGTGSYSVIKSQFKRVGDSAVLSVYLQKDGNNGSGSNPVTISLPNNLISSNSSQGILFIPPSATRIEYGSYIEGSSSFIKARKSVSGTSSDFQGQDWLANQLLLIDIEVPIKGWTSGNKTIGDIDVNVPVIFSATKTSGSISSGSVITNWTSVLEDTAGAFDATSGLYTIPSDGNYAVNYSVGFNNGSGGSIAAQLRDSANTTTLQTSNSNDGTLWFKVGSALFVNAKKGQIIRIWSTNASGTAVGAVFSIHKISGGDIFRTFNRSTTKYLASNITSNTTDIASLRFTNLVVGKLYDLDMTGLGVALDPGTNNQLVITAVHDGGNLTRSIFRNDSASVSSLRKGGRAIFTATATTITFNATFTGSGSLFGDGTAWGSTVVLTELNNTVEGNF